MQISEQQALELLYYGKTRDGQITTQTGDWDLYFALSLCFELLEKHTILDAKVAEKVFKERLTAIANLQIQN